MTTTTIDFEDARYRVATFPGVAFYLTGWTQIWEPNRYYVLDEDGEEYLVDSDEPGDGEWIDDPDRTMVRAVMVGDDTEHLVDIADLELIAADAYCGGCGQIGCAW